MAEAPAPGTLRIEYPATGGIAWRRWFADFGPLLLALLLIWAKLVQLSAFVRSEWWSNEPSIGRWMRPTDDVFSITVTYPQIAIATLACLALAFGPLMLLTRGWRLTASIALNVGLTVLGLADLLHVRFYGDVLSTSSFTTPRMVRDILPSIVDIAKATDPVYVYDLLALPFLVPVLLLASWRVPALDRGIRVRTAIAMVVLGLALALPALDARWRDDDTLFAASSPRIEAAATFGLLPYHVLELVAPRDAAALSHEAQLQRVRAFLASERAQKGPPSPLFGAARGLNVILMSAESLQAFPIGLEVDGQPVAPRLTAFARESLYFTNYHDQTYLGTTSDAQFSVLTGLHPQPIGFVAMDYADRDYRALPAILAERGYATMAAVAAPGEFWNAERLHPRYGIHHTYHEDAYVLTELFGPWLSDRAFFTQTLPFLASEPQPFMADLLTSSNHHPFEMPAELRTLRLGELEGTLLGDYLHSVHVFDQAFGTFVDELRASGLLDHSLFVMYGDHQAFLGDPPALGELLGRPDWTEYDQLVVRKRLPLFIRLPHGAHAGERDVVGGHLDVAPTLLSLLGIEPEDLMLGRDLLRERPSMVVFRDGGFADDSHYYVQRFGSAVSSACYELTTGRPVACAPLDDRRREARLRLEVSDAIVQRNLFPPLSPAP